MIVLILAAGEGTRWYNGNPKQMALIEGKPLIRRTIDMIGNRPSIVVTHIPELQQLANEFYVPRRHRWTVETLFYTQDLWEERTIILLGDVIYSPEALNKILKYRGDLAVFGEGGQKNDEIFGLSFSSDGQQKLLVCLATVIRDCLERNTLGKLWFCYRVMCGFNLDEHKVECDIFHGIEDYTYDIDTIDEYHEFLSNNEWA